MEGIPNNFNEVDQEEPKKSKPKTGLKKVIGKTIALGSVAGLSIFGNVGCSDSEKDKNESQAEQYQKGSSLGPYYKNLFKRKEKELANDRLVLVRAKEVLDDKGISYTEKSKITVTLHANIPVEIILDGQSIPIENKYHTEEELEMLKVRDGATGLIETDTSNKEEKPIQEEGGNTTSSTHTYVSPDADKFF